MTITLALLAAACLTPTKEPAPKPRKKVAANAEAEELRNMIRRLSSAINASNETRYAALFTGDGVLMPYNAPQVAGQDNIRAWAHDMFNRFNFAETMLPPEEIEVAGHLAFVRGSYTQTVTPKGGGEQVQLAGKYLVVFERQPEGTWKLAQAIWNPNNPPQAGVR
ncbi:MAG: SgcJ/EcaC family oxidoreductase [Candidatus Solibacter usitatus]|nr:SgcJ/EcaC family oxidoreductase [Candidatus Solibacter usitatus]